MINYLIVAILFLFLHPLPTQATPIVMQTETAGNWVTYVPKEQYINPSGAPFVAADSTVYFPLRENSLGLGFNGVLKYTPSNNTWQTYTSKDGLFNGAVRSITQTPNGTLWFAGSHQEKAAIAQFDGQNWIIHTNALQGKSMGRTALADSKGNLWFTTEHTSLEKANTDSSQGGFGVFKYDGTTCTHITVANGLAHNRVYDIAEDRRGNLFFATYKGLSQFDPNTNTWTTHTKNEGLGASKVYHVLASREGLIWATHGENNGISIYNHREWRHITHKTGMPITSVRTLTQTHDGAIWFGTHPRDGVTGLIRHHRGTWLRFLEQDGLPHPTVSSIVQNPDHSLWIQTVPNRLVHYTPNLSTLQTVSDIVHDDENKLLPNAGIQLINDQGEVRASTTTNLNGQYRLPMFDEPYTVKIYQPQKISPTLAKNLTGAWQGTIDLSIITLRVVFHIKSNPDGSLTATLDSPDQSTTDIPTSSVDLLRQNLTITVNRVRGKYEGLLNSPTDPTTITGTWSQLGKEHTLTLHKTDTPATINRPQEPKPPFGYHTEDITFTNPTANITLAGTLTKPKTGGPFPAVMLISGSGPQDRNEEILGHKPFLVLADHLTKKGIAVLRVDDRGVGKSTGEYLKATTQDLTTDALSGVAYLKSRKDIRPNQIGLAGHSEGGLIAPLAAIQSSDIAFIVMMAGPGVPGDRIIETQRKAIFEADKVSPALIEHNVTFLKQMCKIIKTEPNNAIAERHIREQYQKLTSKMSKKLLDEYAKIGISDPDAALNASLPMYLSTWYRFFISHDPAETLKKVTCPTLAFIGEKDLQVPAKENLAAIKAAFQAGGNTQVVVTEIPKLNHLFQNAQTGSPTEYAKIEETFAPVALNLISDWILKETNP